MNFGSTSDLDKVNFKFPPDHQDTRKLLPGKESNRFKLYFGCAKWGRKDWVGLLYPPKTKEKDYLNYYSKVFNSIELNATYYKLPSEETINSWKEKTEKDFHFFTKLPRNCGPSKKDNTYQVELFFKNAEAFEKKLGPFFLMLDQRFSIKNFKVLKQYLERLPKGYKLFIEFRHESWFEESDVVEETYALLKKKKIGTIITDTAGRRDMLHQRLTTKEAFIRFVGNFLHPTDFKRIDEWAKRLKKWKENGLKEAYFFMHHNSDKGELYSPELSVYAIKKFNKTLGTTLKVPELYGSTKTKT